MVTIEINGIQVQAEQGQMLIEAADKAGIAIPRFCYHKNLDCPIDNPRNKNKGGDPHERAPSQFIHSDISLRKHKGRVAFLP